MTAASPPYFARIARHAGYWERYRGSTGIESLRGAVNDVHGERLDGDESRVVSRLLEYRNASIPSGRVPMHTQPHAQKALRYTYASLIDSHSPTSLGFAKNRANLESVHMAAAKHANAIFFEMCHGYVQELGGALHNLESIAVSSHDESCSATHTISWGHTHVIEEFINTDVASLSNSGRLWLTKRRRYQTIPSVAFAIRLHRLAVGRGGR